MMTMTTMTMPTPDEMKDEMKNGMMGHMMDDMMNDDTMITMVMPVEQPDELYERFAAALNGNDLEGIVALFDPAGQTIPQPGQPPVGGEGVRVVMAQCLALKPQIRYEKMNIIEADDIALLRSQWRLRVTPPGGQLMEVTGQGLQVARKQADGSWRILIDNPWAAEM
ncbi:MAG: SgcJ/EcaC family oxidoreductase [Caldilineaceae bacterium]